MTDPYDIGSEKQRDILIAVQEAVERYPNLDRAISGCLVGWDHLVVPLVVFQALVVKVAEFIDERERATNGGRMSATAQPNSSVWLGDNWPGPYVVTYDLRRGRALTVVVNGVTSCQDALALAKAEHGVADEDVKSVSICPGRVVEASHHLNLLSELRAVRESSTGSQK